MNRREWAILTTGIGGMLLLSLLFTGFPEFDLSCSETNGEGNCEEEFERFIFTVAWGFFAAIFGGLLTMTGIILFIVDASSQNDAP